MSPPACVCCTPAWHLSCFPFPRAILLQLPSSLGLWHPGQALGAGSALGMAPSGQGGTQLGTPGSQSAAVGKAQGLQPLPVSTSPPGQMDGQMDTPAAMPLPFWSLLPGAARGELPGEPILPSLQIWGGGGTDDATSSPHAWESDPVCVPCGGPGPGSSPLPKWAPWGGWGLTPGDVCPPQVQPVLPHAAGLPLLPAAGEEGPGAVPARPLHAPALLLPR